QSLGACVPRRSLGTRGTAGRCVIMPYAEAGSRLRRNAWNNGSERVRVTEDGGQAMIETELLADRDTARTGPRPVRAPRGPERTCKGWVQEAALRMLMNNLDPEVAEDPDRLVVYGGSGKAARTWQAFDTIVATLRKLDN